MICRWVLGRLGRYVEFSLNSIEASVLRWHLARCARCYERYEGAETMGGLLAELPKVWPPQTMTVRILSAFSIEALVRDRPRMRWDRRRLMLGNMLRPIAIPVLGGLSLALVMVPVLLSAFWMEPVAHADDVPLLFLASPVVSAPIMTLPSPYPVAGNITVVAYIDAHGDVYDYLVASNEPLEGGLHRRLANTLLTSKFQPARRFGQPIPGRRVILFQRVDSRA